MSLYKTASYKLSIGTNWRQLGGQDNGRLGQGLWTISDYKGHISTWNNVNPTLGEELNTFFSRFKVSSDNTKPLSTISTVMDGNAVTGSEDHSFSITEYDVRRALQWAEQQKGCKSRWHRRMIVKIMCQPAISGFHP